MSDTDAAAAMQEELHGCPVVLSHGQRVLLVPRDAYLKTVRALAADGFDMLVDVTGVDYLNMPGRTVGAGVQP